MLSLLLVVNSPLIRDRLIDLLAPLPEIQLRGSASNLASTRQLMDKKRPDAIILDIHLPGGIGFELLKWVKTRSPVTSVIVFTTFAYPQYKKRCLELGADFFIDNLSDIQKISDVLLDHVSKKEKQI